MKILITCSSSGMSAIQPMYLSANKGYSFHSELLKRKLMSSDNLKSRNKTFKIKIHFHTNEPWQVLEYCSTLGDIHDIVVENMQRQQDGLQG